MIKKKSEPSPQIVRYSQEELRARGLSENDKRLLKRLAKMKDENIDFSDIPPVNVDSGKWVVGKFYRPRQEQIRLRIDADVLAWFRAKTANYRSYINDVLRREMMAGLK